MAKPKNPGKFEEYLAPWETKDDDGNVVVGEIQPDKLKKFLHNLLTDKFTAETAVETAQAATAEVQKQLDAKIREGESEEQRRAREAAQQAEQNKQDKQELQETRLANWRLEVALEKKLSPTQVKRLVGSTKDELLKDADAYIEENGIGQEGDEGQGAGSSSEWKPRVLNDPNPLERKDLNDPQKWAEDYAPGGLSI